jgi:hypothetical protein
LELGVSQRKPRNPAPGRENVRTGILDFSIRNTDIIFEAMNNEPVGDELFIESALKKWGRKI